MAKNGKAKSSKSKKKVAKLKKQLRRLESSMDDRFNQFFELTGAPVVAEGEIRSENYRIIEPTD